MATPSVMLGKAKGRPLVGELRLPGDKSISHRTLLLASLAEGTSHLRGLGTGRDVVSTRHCLQRLGVLITGKGPDVTVTGRCAGSTGWVQPLAEPSEVLDCGNAGTTMRLLLGLLAGSSGLALLTGDSSLSARPMRRVIEPLTAMGAQIWGRAAGTCAPLAILGANLRPMRHVIPVASAQVKSALILAGLGLDGHTQVTEPAPSRDHTELMLAAMGATIERHDACTVSVRGPAALRPLDLQVPGDPSSAAFWLAAALIVPGSHVRLCGVGINPRRLGLVSLLQRSGARITVSQTATAGGEPVGDIEVWHSELSSFTVSAAEVPALIDELPLLGLLACLAKGHSVLDGLAELRAKETDRLDCLVRGLRALGAQVEELPDGISVNGPQALTAASRPLASDDDHRMAMTWAVASLVTRGELDFAGRESVSVSYPTFFSDLQSLTGGQTA